MNRLKKLALALSSLLVTLAFTELTLGLLVDVTDDLQYEASPAGGLRLRAYQHGTYIRAELPGVDPIAATFSVNNAGYNNGHEYTTRRTQGKIRIAVVGDSFVEALHVDYDHTFFHVLERQLARDGLEAEVYSFGISGFGTSQVLHLVEKSVLSYSPDFLIYLFVPNDMADSSGYGGRSRWTPQYDLDVKGNLVELPYKEYRLPAWRLFLKHSKLFRYFYYQRRLGEAIRGRKRTSEIAQSASERVRAQRPASQTATKADSQQQRAWLVVERLLVQLDDTMTRAGVPWLLVWQGGIDAEFYQDTRISLEKIVQRQKLPYYDLSSDFARDYVRQHRAFRFRGDGHWNVDGHRVAGLSLASPVRSRLRDRHYPG